MRRLHPDRPHRHQRPGAGCRGTASRTSTAIIEWNDSDERTYEEIRELTAAVLRHLDAQRW